LVSLLEDRFLSQPDANETLREFLSRVCRDARLTPYRQRILTILQIYEDMTFGAKPLPPKVNRHLRELIEEIKNRVEPHTEVLQPKVQTAEGKKEYPKERVEDTEPLQQTRTPVMKVVVDVSSMRARASAKLSNFINSIRRSPHVILYVVMMSTIGFIVRYHLSLTTPLHGHEATEMYHAFYISNALRDWRSFLRFGWWAVFVSGYEIGFHLHPPLYTFLVGLLFRLNDGASLFLQRIPNLIAGTFAIPLFFLLSKKIYDSDMAGVFSSTFVSLYPFFVWWGGAVSTPYSATVDFILLATLYLLQGVYQKGLRNHLLAGFFVGLALLTSTEAIALIPVIVLFCLYASITRTQTPLHAMSSIWDVKKHEYPAGVRGLIFTRSFALLLLTPISLYLPFIATTAYQKFIQGIPRYSNYLDLTVDLTVRPTEVAQNIRHIPKVLSERWIYPFGVLPPPLTPPSVTDVPFTQIILFSAGVLCALVRPRVGDKLLLTLLFTFLAPLSVIGGSDLNQFHVPVACMVLLCSGLLQKLGQGIYRKVHGVNGIKQGNKRRGFSARSAIYYVFWVSMIVILVAPNLTGRVNTIAQLMSLPARMSTDEDLARYVIENFPQHPVVFVDMPPTWYYVIPFLALNDKNDVYQGYLDEDPSGENFFFYIHPDTRLYQSGLFSPRNPINGTLEEFLSTITVPSLFFFATHNTTIYNVAMNYVERANVSLVFVRQWDYQPRFAPVKLYLVFPITTYNSTDSIYKSI